MRAKRQWFRQDTGIVVDIREDGDWSGGYVCDIEYADGTIVQQSPELFSKFYDWFEIEPPDAVTAEA